MMARIKVGSGVTGAVHYILGEGRDPVTGEVKILAADQRTRVDWIHIPDNHRMGTLVQSTERPATPLIVP